MAGGKISQTYYFLKFFEIQMSCRITLTFQEPLQNFISLYCLQTKLCSSYMSTCLQQCSRSVN